MFRYLLARASLIGLRHSGISHALERTIEFIRRLGASRRFSDQKQWPTPERRTRCDVVQLIGCLSLVMGQCVLCGQSFRQTPDIQSISPVNAPSLDGGVEWLNVAGPLSLADLRGKIVVLDFWTYCCINCIQTLPDLQRLEREYANQIVVVGVHAPKFVGERDTQNVREAILRYGIEHPVVNDANAIVARKYGVTSWPTLRFLDPAGNVIASHEGEATFAALNTFMKKTVGKYRRAGNLDETPLRFALERETAEPTPLRFPGKLLADPIAKRLYIADSGHHRIVVASLDGKKLGTIGTGRIGRTDGAFSAATFSSPQGLALRGSQLYVADTENHSIRKIDLRTGKVSTIAGTGEQAPSVIVRSTTRPLGMPLASPWALVVAFSSGLFSSSKLANCTSASGLPLVWLKAWTVASRSVNFHSSPMSVS